MINDLNGKELTIGDPVLIKRSYGDYVELGHISGSTPKKIKVTSAYADTTRERTVQNVILVEGHSEESIQFFIDSFNKLI